jgi:hypothetical protein
MGRDLLDQRAGQPRVALREDERPLVELARVDERRVAQPASVERITTTSITTNVRMMTVGRIFRTLRRP